MNFDTPEAVAAQLQAGEDGIAEFKEVRLTADRVDAPHADALAGEMVSFANAEGGAVFLGVDDAGQIVGIPAERAGDVERWVVNVATQNCDPPIRPLIRRFRLPRPDGGSALIMLVQVGRGLHVHRTHSGRWLVRVGSTRRDLTQAELSRLFQERGRIFVFDESVVPAASLDDLDERTLRDALGASKALAWEQLLHNVRVLSADPAGDLRPTVAGMLCFGRRPEEHVPGATIHAAVYRGTRRHSGDLVHQSDIGGRVQDQIDEAVGFADRFMLKPATKDVGRHDHPQYLLGPVMEAVVNAVAHRDYSIAGSRVRLFLYADRLEVISPGALPNSMTLEALRFRQFTRNQLLVSFLSRMHSRRNGARLIETRGEGVARILDECTAYAGRPPEYALHGAELYLTVWARPSPHDVAA